MIGRVRPGEQGDLHRAAPYVTLMEYLALPGCPICRIGHEQEHSFIDILFYERVNEPELRLDLKKSFGFCQAHALQVISFGDPLGNAIIYENLLSDIKERLKTAVAKPAGAAPMVERFFHSRDGQPLSAEAECPICVSKRAREQDYVDFLVCHLDDDALAAAYGLSSGMCVPHLNEAVKIAQRGSFHRQLTRLQRLEAAIMDRLKDELKEIMRKHDYRFSAEPLGPERDAWIRAIRKVSGSPP